MYFFIQNFYNIKCLGYGMNESFITLIPKKRNPSSIGDYKSNSLVGGINKLIAKLLAIRLRKVVGSCLFGVAVQKEIMESWGSRIHYKVTANLGVSVGVAEKMNGIKLLSVAKAPALFNWAHRFCCDATVKDVMPDTENLAEFGKMITAKVMDVAPPKWLTE
ncbi:Uncharacterized protein TCM_010053 [Theobroma cacao]|uniref:Uncharacterized protein n=1 Tax=Theobroma cacao TaxID=3641 RepID=A0A061E5F9_THECC|nr:Uncharacterized protein TCM_010053 [Theobroma cacao]